MKITSKKQLKFYIEADRIMNGYTPCETLKERISEYVLATPPVMSYLKNMRKLSYYKNRKDFISKLYLLYLIRKKNKLSVKCSGLHINEDVFGYGLVVPHQGAIRIGFTNSVGKYAVIHTMAEMTGSNIKAGDCLYLSVGCKVVGPLTLGDNVTVAANSVVRKSCDNNSFLAGMPATVKRDNYPIWYNRDGEEFKNRVKKCEALREKYGLPENC